MSIFNAAKILCLGILIRYATAHAGMVSTVPPSRLVAHGHQAPRHTSDKLYEPQGSAGDGFEKNMDDLAGRLLAGIGWLACDVVGAGVFPNQVPDRAGAWSVGF
ncbi:hypothetical protein [Rhodoferax sp. WC2427]|uniref:hypothetical protein n=1 Tax=Rhodoferax sp. WC2427 TaxID=3234144 RepID=UPI003465CE5C